ncbi:Nif3-like dinuclear metal center hexameric protein [Listeria innocua]|uniref:Nif3-like dinuclear metal center hexameric protein n=1 Tax=Listeria innocua TaxID=1642 RepID=UPI00162A10FC|nr:Nif3-like dinuclear metal center hexameric protein [Listeria innocua]MBC1377620.1 Nif3-like dinuclear metal center hexameric protein [Listeria innocua]
MKVANGYEYTAIMEKIAPKKLAMEGDPIGLQVGDLSKKVRKVMFTLDVLEEVVDEAIEKRVDLIIAHHPFLYRPTQHIDTTTKQGKMIKKLIKHDITVFAAHTNLDIAQGGVNDILADLLHLQDTTMIEETYTEPYCKIAVYVPENELESVRLALVNNGAGQIGTNYTECTFHTTGIGSFKPGSDANPTIGEKETLTAIPEVKIEAIFPQYLTETITKAVKIAHPYEEPAIDVYTLETQTYKEGLGRVGTLPKKISMVSFIDKLKTAFAIDNVRFVGDLKASVQKVAIIGGDGNKFIHQAKATGADVFITGDVYYHTAHDLLAINLPTIDAGHNIEKVMKGFLKNKMEEQAKILDYEAEFIVSEVNTDPFQFC